MIQPKPKKQKKPLVERLPKVGRASRVALVVGIFVIVFASLLFVSNQQASRQAELRKNIATSQRGLSAGTQEEPKYKLEAQIKQAEAEMEADRVIFPIADQVQEILDRLLKLAEANDVDVTNIAVTTSPKILDKVAYDVFTFQFTLRGQVPNFQNFLLALGDRLPTSQISAVNITVAAEESEEDIASVTIEVLCYSGK